VPFRIGHPLVRLNFDQQRYEADFRFSLVRFRENTEGVAFYHGEAGELRSFRERFGNIVRNWRGIMRQQKRLTWLTAGYGQATVIFPLIVVAPRYFRGRIILGGLKPGDLWVYNLAKSFDGKIITALLWVPFNLKRDGSSPALGRRSERRGGGSGLSQSHRLCRS
jgi:ABC-type uncharacterized transport system fused permease/ATPase subunit